ncbi:MAG: leucyl/phenylalanyl-tRNA--protein transferase [Cyclonatronaceae bacterium]
MPSSKHPHTRPPHDWSRDPAFARIIPPEEIIEAYKTGYFPMADSSRADADVFWYTAYERGIIPLEKFHMPRRSRKYFRQYDFTCTINHDFAGVIDGCAERETTWINPVIRNTFLYLYEHELAHSVEVRKKDKLVGGLYGLALGGAFFAESMFQYHDEGHKAALYFCHQQLVQQGFTLWDVQFKTPHLAQFGCEKIARGKYKNMLAHALARQVSFV